MDVLVGFEECKHVSLVRSSKYVRRFVHYIYIYIYIYIRMQAREPCSVVQVCA
jgi:hypothetical protein